MYKNSSVQKKVATIENIVWSCHRKKETHFRKMSFTRFGWDPASYWSQQGIFFLVSVGFGSQPLFLTVHRINLVLRLSRLNWTNNTYSDNAEPCLTNSSMFWMTACMPPLLLVSLSFPRDTKKASCPCATCSCPRSRVHAGARYRVMLFSKTFKSSYTF